MQRNEDFETWLKAPLYRRTLDLLTRRSNWEITVPLGAGIGTKPSSPFRW